MPRPSNFSSFNDPILSFMQNLRNEDRIPSTSWAYTAGNRYREYSIQPWKVLSLIKSRTQRGTRFVDVGRLRHLKIHPQHPLLDL